MREIISKLTVLSALLLSFAAQPFAAFAGEGNSCSGILSEAVKKQLSQIDEANAELEGVPGIADKPLNRIATFPGLREGKLKEPTVPTPKTVVLAKSADPITGEKSNVVDFRFMQELSKQPAIEKDHEAWVPGPETDKTPTTEIDPAREKIEAAIQNRRFSYDPATLRKRSTVVPFRDAEGNPVTEVVENPFLDTPEGEAAIDQAENIVTIAQASQLSPRLQELRKKENEDIYTEAYAFDINTAEAVESLVVGTPWNPKIYRAVQLNHTRDPDSPIEYGSYVVAPINSIQQANIYFSRYELDAMIFNATNDTYLKREPSFATALSKRLVQAGIAEELADIIETELRERGIDGFPDDKVVPRKLKGFYSKPLGMMIFNLAKIFDHRFVHILDDGTFVDIDDFKEYLDIVGPANDYDIAEASFDLRILDNGLSATLSEDSSNENLSDTQDFPGKVKLQEKIAQRNTQGARPSLAQRKFDKRVAAAKKLNRPTPETPSEQDLWERAEADNVLDFKRESVRAREARNLEEMDAEHEAYLAGEAVFAPLDSIIEMHNMQDVANYKEDPPWSPEHRVIQVTSSPEQPRPVGAYIVSTKNNPDDLSDIFTSAVELHTIVANAKSSNLELGGTFSGAIGHELRKIGINEEVVLEVMKSLTDFGFDIVKQDEYLSDLADNLTWPTLAEELAYTAEEMAIEFNVISPDGEVLGLMDYKDYL